MITIRELVQDPTYKEFLQSAPKMPKHYKDPDSILSPPWVVYVQLHVDGAWKKREFWKYKEAFSFLKKVLKSSAHDAAINNKRFGYNPPKRLVRVKGKFHVGSDGVRRQVTKEIPWKPRLPADEVDHHWCKFCRRPTLFKYYSRHRILGACSQDVPRCCICGASARIALAPGDRLFRIH